jgi:hypothetical protein
MEYALVEIVNIYLPAEKFTVRAVAVRGRGRAPRATGLDLTVRTTREGICTPDPATKGLFRRGL